MQKLYLIRKGTPVLAISSEGMLSEKSSKHLVFEDDDSVRITKTDYIFQSNKTDYFVKIEDVVVIK